MFFGNCVGVMSTLAAPALKEEQWFAKKRHTEAWRSELPE